MVTISIFIPQQQRHGEIETLAKGHTVELVEPTAWCCPLFPGLQEWGSQYSGLWSWPVGETQPCKYDPPAGGHLGRPKGRPS